MFCSAYLVSTGVCFICQPSRNSLDPYKFVGKWGARESEEEDAVASGRGEAGEAHSSRKRGRGASFSFIYIYSTDSERSRLAVHADKNYLRKKGDRTAKEKYTIFTAILLLKKLVPYIVYRHACNYTAVLYSTHLP